MQPTEINLGHGVTSGDLWKLTYEYGELESNGTVSTSKNTGNVVRQSVTFSGLSHPFVQSYKYDPLQRLTEAKETKNGNQTWLQQFGYDRYGNRASTNQSVNGSTITTTPAVNANTNRFTGSTFEYDKNGNITRDTSIANATRTFVFNGDNKQRQVLDANNVAIGTYYYDGEGKRVKKVTATETTIYVFSSGKLVAEYTNTTPPSNPTVSYTATDLLGSPRVLTNSLGEVVSRRDFLPFGEEVYADGSNRTTANKYTTSGQDGVRKRFTGYEKDTETQLDFAEARMYENRYGRFTAVDPLLASGKSVTPQTFNRYVYAINSPLIFVDPDGMQIATAAGQVYINAAGTQVRIFAGKPRPGFKELTHNITTTTMVKGVAHHMSITPNGWAIGGRVDQKTFAPKKVDPVQKKPVENDAIRKLATGVSDGVTDGVKGIGKGIVNSPSFAWNGLTSCLLNCHVAGQMYFKGGNPFAVPNIIDYNNAREASYGSAGSTGFLAGLGGAVGVFGRASSLPSVVPQSSAPRFLYHYTSSETAGLIESSGQIGLSGRPVYTTSNGTLTSTQAQIELALPRTNSATSAFEIDTNLLNFSPTRFGRVTGNVNNRAGGGIEYIFEQPIPQTAFTRIR